MLNSGDGTNVPDKTIAIFLDDLDEASSFTVDRIPNIIKKPPKTRDWFDSHFYRCLPLAIGNTYGFMISSEWGFTAIWDGGDSPESIKIYYDDSLDNANLYPRISSVFGHGILTIDTPFSLRTPPGVNIMTMNPPNYILPAITVMTGVVETDNLRRNFTFNLKMQMANVEVTVPPGFPLAAFIPLPRYYSDTFEIKEASELFSEEIVIEEIQARQDTVLERKTVDLKKPNKVNKRYMRGVDVYDNKFLDHQTPTRKQE